MPRRSGRELEHCEVLPSFLSGFVSGSLREIALGFGLLDGVHRLPACVDWKALDEALVRLHERNHELAVALSFRILLLERLGPSSALEGVQAKLASFLADALQTGIPISVALYDGASSESTKVGAVQLSPTAAAS